MGWITKNTLLRIALLVSCWLLAATAWAQPGATTAQLWQRLRQHPAADTQRVNLLNQLADYMQADLTYSTLPQARRDSLARQARQLAQQLHYAYGEAYAHFLLLENDQDLEPSQKQAQLSGLLPVAERSPAKPLFIRIVYGLDAAAPNFIQHLQQAIRLAAATEERAILVSLYLRESTYYRQKEGNYYLALQALFRALPVARLARQQYVVGEVFVLGELEELYIDLGDYDQALAYAQQNLASIGQLPDRTHTAGMQANVRLDMGECYRLTGRYEQAAAAYQQVMQMPPDTEINFIVLNARCGLADVYERQRSPQALPYAYQVLHATRQSAGRFAWSSQARICTTLGHYYLRTGPADSAVYYGQQAMQLAQRTQNKEATRDAAQLLAQAYAQRQQYGPAYAYQRRYLGLKDTLNNEQTTRQATAARFTADLARQKSQIALLTRNQQLQVEAARRQQWLLLAALAVLLLLGGLGFVLWRHGRQQQLANTLLAQQKADVQTQRDQTQRALTELKATQSQLIQREKMASLGELTAGIAHEIQNPLNFVNNFADVSTELVAELQAAQATGDATEATALTGDLAQNLGKIHQHGQRAASIVRGMLEHARTSTGERAPTDVNALCDEYLRLAYHGLRAKDKSFNATLTTNLTAGLPLVPAVSQDLGRVVLNLLNNAFYAVQKRQQQGEVGYQPTVSISTRRVGERVEIQVRDNGTGIAAEAQVKIFQPFFTTKPPGEGTGLGLSLSYDIITKGHGGDLAVASEPGQGTEFSIGLPL